MVDKKVQRIKFIIAVIVVICVGITVFIRVNEYNKNGEKNMPFNISKIIIISTAQKDESVDAPTDLNSESIWNFNIIQNNDIYLKIDESEGHKEKLKSVTISNIEVVQPPQKGILRPYMPNSLDGDRYTYTSDYTVSGSLTYRGAEESNYKNLQVNQNGGVIGISFANKDLEKYSSGEDTEVTYDGKMLSKLGITDEDMKSKIAFDLIIELDDGKSYSGRVNLDINCEGLVENGTSQIEISDFSNVVFKRI